MLLCGELIRATRALDWGLVNQVTEADRCLPEAIRVGKYMMTSAPQALAAVKRLLDEAQGRPRSLRGAAAVSAAIRVSEEAQEGIRAFLEKRPPRWVETHA
jgi:methylglutaconyl-CoA hydratase